MRSKTSKLIVLNFILLSVLFPFQNCSNKINSEMVSESLNSSLSTADTGPEIAFVEKTSLYNTRNVVSNFSMTGAEPLTIKSIKCQLGNQAAQDCSSQSVQSNNLTDGDYVLKVIVEMVSGKIFELSRNFRIDATVPTLGISQTPASITNAQTASFTFLSADNLSGILSTECSIDNAAYALCTSPKALNGVSAGTHNIKIKTTDRAGNVSSVYSFNWTVDLSMLTVTLQSTPASVVANANATFSFSGSGIVSYECSIDNAAYVACASPKSYTGLSSATHNFKVRGQNAQNVQSSAVSYNWTIDTVVPTKPVLTSSYQAVGSTKSGNFIFSSIDAGSGIKEHQCSLNNTAYAVCSSPVATTAVEGSNNFKVRSIDLAGNVSVESVMTFTVNTVVVPPPPASGTMKTIFMAQGHGGRTLMSCDDGLSWINDRAEAGADESDHSVFAGRGIEAGGGYFYANFGWGYNGPLRRSRDGINWENIQTGDWGGGVAAGKDYVFRYAEGGRWYSSANQGTTWTDLTDAQLGFDGYQLDHPNVKRVGNKIFVAGRNQKMAVSYDQGRTWRLVLPSLIGIDPSSNFAEGNGVIIAATFNHTKGKGEISRSIDNGLTWTGYELGGQWSAPVFNGTHFIAWTQGKTWKSTDGLNWTNEVMKIDNQNAIGWWLAVTQFNPKTGTYVGIMSAWAQTGDKQRAYRSLDGVNWTTLDATKFKGGTSMMGMITGEIESKYCP